MGASVVVKNVTILRLKPTFRIEAARELMASLSSFFVEGLQVDLVKGRNWKSLESEVCEVGR